jgi:transcriptional regulator with XRE-family HTH domain
MGKAGQALKQTLEQHGISQYKLAEVMGIERNNVSRWVREERDPTAEKVIEIIRGLKKIDPLSAQEFVFLYAVDELEKQEISNLLARAEIDDR